MLRCIGAVKDTGEVIRFTGQYKASRGQAAALVFYVFMGEPSQLCRRAVCLHLGTSKTSAYGGHCLLAAMLPLLFQPLGESL